jgi:hypothetical protein
VEHLPASHSKNRRYNGAKFLNHIQTGTVEIESVLDIEIDLMFEYPSPKDGSIKLIQKLHPRTKRKSTSMMCLRFASGCAANDKGVA